MARILVTRPVDDAEGTASLLAAAGHSVVLAPMLQVHPLAFELPAGSFDQVVLTSASAVRAVAPHAGFSRLRSLPLTVVGERTAQSARAAGFSSVSYGGPDARALVAGIVRNWPPAQEVLYLAGRYRRAELGRDLAPYGHSVHELAVYAAEQAVVLPAAAHAALASRQIDIVLHYSRRTAEALLAAMAASGLDHALSIRHLCLSAHVAGALTDAGIGRVEVASTPDEVALLALIAE